MDHQPGRSRIGGRPRQPLGVLDRPADPGQQRYAPVDLLRRHPHEILGLFQSQPVELPRVSVRDQNMDAGSDGAVDDRPQRPGVQPVLTVEGGDENA